MKKIVKTPYYSRRLGTLAKGCQQCVRGEKLVVFVTGICPRHCYYCPISDKKFQKDVIFANERPVKKVQEIIEEAKTSSSKGAGFTGGDPLARLDRTIKYIKALKKEFGNKFHIHLYTSFNLVNRKVLRRLYEAGLDEIRFHPDLDDERLWNRISHASEYDWDYGAEIPVIPGKIKETKKLMRFLDGKIKFLNLNELELSDGKASSLSERGYVPKDYLSYGAKGSDQMAKELLRYAQQSGFKYKVHYCTAKLKDKIQLSKRILRRGKNVKKKFDILTKEGLLVRGAIYDETSIPDKKRKETKENYLAIRKLEKMMRYMERDVGVPKELYELDKEKKRILTNAGIVMKLSEEIKKQGLVPTIVTEYPTWDGLIIELEKA